MPALKLKTQLFQIGQMFKLNVEAIDLNQSQMKTRQIGQIVKGIARKTLWIKVNLLNILI